MKLRDQQMMPSKKLFVVVTFITKSLDSFWNMC